MRVRKSVLAGFAMLLAGLVLAGAASEPIALAGKPGPKSKCTVKGTAGADKLRGRPGRDVICARGGNDRVVALGGPDQLLGGPGNDELHGDAGNDDLVGGPGDDALDGGDGRNTCAAAGALEGPNLCVDYLTVESVKLSPRQVDTSAGPGSVGVELAISNTEPEALPIRQILVPFRPQSESESKSITDARRGPPPPPPHPPPEGEFGGPGVLELIEGDGTRGIWSGQMSVKRNVAKGTYEVDLHIYVGNEYPTIGDDIRFIKSQQLRAAGFESTFEQIGSSHTGSGPRRQLRPRPVAG